MSVKETHLKGTPQSVTKYVSEEKDARKIHSGEEDTVGYCFANDTVQGIWMGKGAAAQGLFGVVKNEDLEKLLSGVMMDGQDISQRGNHQHDRRMGSDWTFSAPKAASIMAIEDPRIQDWMMESVKETMEAFYAQEMSFARKGKGGVITEFSEGIAAAGYLHQTARAADGIIDPQIHVHVVVPNLVQRSDGQWASLRSDYGQNSRKIYAMGDDQVARLMQKMHEQGGYDFEARLERDTKGIEHLSFGIKGISEAAEGTFSGRKKQMQAYLRKNGIDPGRATRKQRDAAILNTRAGKDKNLDKVSLQHVLRQRAQDAGIDFPTIRAAAAKHAAVTQKQQSCTGMDVTKISVHSLSDFGEDVAIIHDYQSAFGPDLIGQQGE